ncbi:MAG TPA: SDR family NAD(P)-dependent oxidoreductase [Mycobacteriales bacterium]|nr:SDR family NAD(P)-dependent oxidoreductase [Mycobacteriales bacterium]
MRARLAVVVGAGPGIGQAVGRRFGREGYRVVLAARRPDRLVGIAAALARDNIEAVPLQVDVTDLAALRAGMATVTRQVGDPDVLVYNAAWSPTVRPTQVDVDTLLDSLRVNVVGALVCAQAVLGAMRRAGRGSILFTGEGHALSPRPEAAVLGVGKAALRNLTFSLARELEPDGIHVATVTVNGRVAPRTPFDPELVADAFWRLHCEQAGEWSTELLFHGHPR